MIYLQLYLQTFFTSFPQKIYSDATDTGNLAFAGIGIGLIRAQTAFWLSVCIGAVSLSIWNTTTYFPLQYSMGIISAFLFVNSVRLCGEMIKYLPYLPNDIAGRSNQIPI